MYAEYKNVPTCIRGVQGMYMEYGIDKLIRGVQTSIIHDTESP